MSKKPAKKRQRGATLPSGSFEGTGGRPSELTPEIQQKIVGAIMVNGYVETAAAFAGISKDTFYNWLKRGARANRGRYKEFSDAIGKAIAEAEVRMSMVVVKAANGYDVIEKRTVIGQDKEGKPVNTVTESSRHEFNPQAAEWWLERRFPNHWGRREYVEMAGDPAKPIQIEAEVNIYDPLRMAKLIAAFADVQLISPAVIELIEGKDFTAGNGQSPD